MEEDITWGVMEAGQDQDEGRDQDRDQDRDQGQDQDQDQGQDQEEWVDTEEDTEVEVADVKYRNRRTPIMIIIVIHIIIDNG